MTISAELLTLTKWMAGEFSNQAQALAEPIWYVNLRWWQRPIPFQVFKGLALFAEQANVLNLDRPYRQRILQFQEENSKIWVNYYALRDPSAWQGAGADARRLAGLTFADLEPLSGCRLQVIHSGTTNSAQDPEKYKADLIPDTKCCFTYMGEIKQVILGFEVTASSFWSYDRGVKPETGEAIWGAIMGPYQFVKQQDFASEFAIDD
ncbi:chromophore lyase CpcT/CpeT [Tumidithrix helvetica PCC 7403]|uniref:chromophore lyase CpcT/CpeT n=1 Tax=Tumidithrix helvetica TaxID=3457545 RepID=UPI003C96395B